jgi:sugar fermentation stimulation protein A
MEFQATLVHGKLLKRYKRFLADIELDNGEVVTAHCTNTGSMKSCIEIGAEVYLSPTNNPLRKTKFTWEMIKINGDWVGINTNNPNQLAFEAISKHEIPELSGYTEVFREVKWDDSRFDIMAKNETETCFFEVKNVSMKEGDFALFPDAITLRGRKHLETLIRVKKAGMRAIMLYIVQRCDVSKFSTAKEIDPEYSETLKKAITNGVEIFVIQAKVTPTSITINKRIPFEM